MDSVQSMGLANRYALFLDDDADPLEVLKSRELEKESRRKQRGAEKENKGKPEVVPKPPKAKGIKDTANLKQQLECKREAAKECKEPNKEYREPNKEYREPHKEYREPHKEYREAKPPRSATRNGPEEEREERNNRRNREDQPRPTTLPGDAVREERPRRDPIDDARGRGRGLGRARAVRGTRTPFDQRGKREFDRQSGSDKTGVKSIDKKDGAGAHNWGSHKDIIEEVDKSEELNWNEPKDESPSAPVTTENKDANAAEPAPEPAPTEEEPKELTLDEWKAQKGVRQKPTYNLRKAGEGEDPGQWKKMYELNKKKEAGADPDAGSEEEEFENQQRAGKQKQLQLLDINIHFSDSRRGGMGRGRGRGGGRGRGAVGPREPRERQNPARPYRNNHDEYRPSFAEGAGQSEEHYRADRDRDGAAKPARQNAPKVDDEHDFPSLN